jgi:hypothetical protein
MTRQRDRFWLWTNRLIRAFSLIVLSLCTAGLAACGGGPYADLAKDFSGEAEDAGTRLDVKRVVMVSIRHRGAYNFGGLHVSLTRDAVHIRPRFPLSLSLEPLILPAASVAGCTMTCFGIDDQHADLVFEKQGVEVSFDTAPELVDWCWRNGLRMLTGKEERGWLHSGQRLPDKASYVRVEISEYEEQAQSACMGY